MNIYTADLHIHTLMSPCGSLYMSPNNIIEQACKMGIDIIGITDHNTTRQAPLSYEIGKSKGIYVLCGVEITTQEEAHCLAFFPDITTLSQFQQYLDNYLPNIKNNTDKFGYQVCVNQNEDIVYEEERLLLSGLNQSIDQIEQHVHQLGGLFIPAHIDRPMFSLSSQLGFVPASLKYDALELSRHTTPEKYLKDNSYLEGAVFIQSSDAHRVDDIGKITTQFYLEHRSFDEITMALKNEGGRKVLINK